MQGTYLGPWRSARGLSLVTFRNELPVIYLLDFTPMFVGVDCVVVVAVGRSLGVYISPERRFSFSLAASSLPWRFGCWTPGGCGVLKLR